MQLLIIVLLISSCALPPHFPVKRGYKPRLKTEQELYQEYLYKEQERRYNEKENIYPVIYPNGRKHCDYFCY